VIAELEMQFKQELVSWGIPESQARPSAVEYVRSNVKSPFRGSGDPGTGDV
jgi:hypothetical protein